MCQGMNICGEVGVCNATLKCGRKATKLERNNNDQITVTKTLLESEMTSDHFYCHYLDYFENDFEYDYFNRKDEDIKSGLDTTIATSVNYSSMFPCLSYYWNDSIIDNNNTTCNCALPGLHCPGHSIAGSHSYEDACVIIPLWCNDEQKATCKVGNQTWSTADENLCKNYTFWRSIYENEKMSISVANNQVKLKSFHCLGKNQALNLPWYSNSIGKFDGALRVTQQTCKDSSDRIFRQHTSCDSKTFLQLYSDMWCGEEEAGSEVVTLCKALQLQNLTLEQWFSSQEDDVYKDPHQCQDSCSAPAPGCEACTNTDTHFVCEMSGVCVHKDLVCDGHPQCEFGEDEAFDRCKRKWVETGVVEPYASFTCKSVMYPAMTTVATACNGIIECYNGSDEDACSDSNLVYILVTFVIAVILLYFALKYYSHNNKAFFTKAKHISNDSKVEFDLGNLLESRKDSERFDFETHQDEKDTILHVNNLLLQMIFSERRDVIKKKCILFYDLVARAKNNNESETFCYIHNNFDSNVAKEILKAKFPGLTEKMTDKVEKLCHRRFITQFQDKLTANSMLDEQVSSCNTIRRIVSYSLDLFKDSYLAFYLLVISGGPKALMEFITNFTSALIISLIGTIVVPIIATSAYFAIKDPHIVFSFMEGASAKWKRRTVSILCLVCGPLNPVFLFHSLQTTLGKAKRSAKQKGNDVFDLMKKVKEIKSLIASSLRIELGESISAFFTR